MNRHRKNKEISAYLDGESRRPEEVERYLREDAEAASAQRAYARLSECLKALPRTEVSPAFSRRVMLAIEETDRRRVPWYQHMAMPIAVAAAALVAVGVILVTGTDEATAPKVTQIPALEAPAGPIIALNEPVAPAQPAELFATDLTPRPESFDASTEDMLLALATSEWFDSFAEGWEDSRDYSTALSDLNQAEAEVFLELLGETARQEILGESQDV